MPVAAHIEHHFTATDATVRDVVIGMSDGLDGSFQLLAAGLSGAKVGTSVVVLAWTGRKSPPARSPWVSADIRRAGPTRSIIESELAAGEIREAREIPEEEAAEVSRVFQGWGLTDQQIQPIVAAISSDEKRWVDFHGDAI